MPDPTPTLGRTVKGLPRYFMDCGWWRHPRFAGLTPESLFVFQSIVSYSTEHASDGKTPSDLEDLAAAIGLRFSIVKKAVPPLIKREILAPDGDLLVVRGWADHNPTTAEMEAYQQARSKKGTLGNHKRWHESKGIVHPDCEWCGDSLNDPPTNPPGIVQGSHGMGWDGSSSSSPPQRAPETTPGVAGAGAPTEDDQPRTPTQTADAAIAHMALADEHWARLDGTPIRNRNAWLKAATTNRREAHHRQLTELAEQQPTANPVTLAEQIDPKCGPLDGGAQRSADAWTATQAELAQQRQDEADARQRNRHAKALIAALDDHEYRQLQDRARQLHPEGTSDKLLELSMRALVTDPTPETR